MTSKKRKKGKIRWHRAAIVAASGLICLGAAGFAVWKGAAWTIAKLTPQPEPSCIPVEGTTACFTFTGVGDNLLHETLFEGDTEDKINRNFSPIYELTRPYTSSSDLSYINFETLCAGDEFGFSGYPDFNAPAEFIDALAQSGFNWFSLASNHSLDRGPEGMAAQLKNISENYPEITYTGAHLNKETADEPVILEINGIKVGLATFAYGLNGRDKPEGYEWQIDTYKDNYGTLEKELLEKRLSDLEKNSDVQIVSMHWGIEYNPVVDNEQAWMTSMLMDHGVDVIIGTHPHTIAPAEYLERNGQKALVYYSLGNFVSDQEDLMTMTGGMASFQVNWNEETGDVIISDAKFTPTVTWMDEGENVFKTTTIHEYTDELAASHRLQLEGKADLSRQAVQNWVISVLGYPEGIQLDIGEGAVEPGV